MLPPPHDDAAVPASSAPEPATRDLTSRPLPDAAPSARPDLPAPDAAARRAGRLASLIEVVLCSGFPTQLVVTLALAAAGWQPFRPDGVLSLPFVAALSFLDTVLMLVLIGCFLHWRQDDARALFLGGRATSREAWVGVWLVPVTFGLVASLAVVISRIAPWLRNVPENPLAAMISTRGDLAVLAVTVVVAGGIREELQRAFVLNRFERDLGGARAGLLVFSIAFGLGHTIQGWDAAILTGALGVLWGATYLWRRSVVAPIVCHALFNLAEVIYHGTTM